jgi:hypothetical protein
MLALTHRGWLIMVLDEENVERLQQNDPIDFTMGRSPVPLVLTLPLKLMITYAKKEELAKIEAMVEFPDELIKYLRRGYKETAADRERDKGYQPIGTKTSGTQH